MCETSTNVCFYRKKASESVLTWDPAGHHPGVPLRAVGVLGPRLQMENTLVLQHKPHKEPGDGHIGRAKIDDQILRLGASSMLWTFAHKGPQHERKGRVKLLLVCVFGVGGEVGRWQQP